MSEFEGLPRESDSGAADTVKWQVDKPRAGKHPIGCRDRVSRLHYTVWSSGKGDLPSPGLQHVRFVQRADGQAFHRSLQVFADFK